MQPQCCSMEQIANNKRYIDWRTVTPSQAVIDLELTPQCEGSHGYKTTFNCWRRSCNSGNEEEEEEVEEGSLEGKLANDASGSSQINRYNRITMKLTSRHCSIIKHVPIVVDPSLATLALASYKDPSPPSNNADLFPDMLARHCPHFLHHFGGTLSVPIPTACYLPSIGNMTPVLSTDQIAQVAPQTAFLCW